jgi:hypothetical protein
LFADDSTLLKEVHFSQRISLMLEVTESGWHSLQLALTLAGKIIGLYSMPDYKNMNGCKDVFLQAD